MKKRICLLLVALVFIFTGCSGDGTGEVADLKLIDEVEISIFAKANLEETWIMHVSKDGVFTSMHGQRVDNEITLNRYLNAATMQREATKLTQKQIERLNDALLTLRQQEEIELRTESTDPKLQVRVCLNQHQYNFYYTTADAQTSVYIDFVNTFMADSPMEITL